MLWYNKFVELVRMMIIGAEEEADDKIGDKLFMKEFLCEWKRENDFNRSIVSLSLSLKKNLTTASNAKSPPTSNLQMSCTACIPHSSTLILCSSTIFYDNESVQ